MESAIVKNLQPEFEPVAVVWSDTLPDDVRQFNILRDDHKYVNNFLLMTAE